MAQTISLFTTLRFWFAVLKLHIWYLLYIGCKWHCWALVGGKSRSDLWYLYIKPDLTRQGKILKNISCSGYTRSRKCSSEEISCHKSLRQKISGQGIVWSRKFLSGNCPLENCPTVTKILEFQLIKIAIPS